MRGGSDREGLLAGMEACGCAYRTLEVGGTRSSFVAGFLTGGRLSGQETWRTQGSYALLYLLRGSGTYQGPDDEVVVLRPGSALHRFRGEPFRLHRDPDGGWLEFALKVPDALVDALCVCGGLDSSRRVQWPGLTVYLLELCRNMTERLGSASPAELPGLLADAHTLLARLSEAGASHRQRRPHTVVVKQACRILEQQLEIRINAPDWLAGLGLGYERLRKVFKEHMGCAPQEYRIRCRTNKAQQLLGDFTLSIKEIAERLGYSDTAAFSGQFRKFAGVSPAAFRKAL